MDDRAFDDFYQATRHRVVAFLYAITGDRADAQDVAQDAYERAWQRWAALSAYDDPEAWVRQVGYRLAISRWRKARNRITAHGRHGPDPHADPPSENTVMVIAALRGLPEDLRLVVAMHHLLDLPVATVARQTGTPVNTVKARLVRARKLMAERIGPRHTEEARNA